MNDISKLSFIDYLYSFVRTQATNNQQNIAKNIQGHVSKILPGDFLEFTIDATGPYTLPKLQIPQAFSKYHREPTQVNDKGYAIANDFFIGGESGQDGSTANMYPRGNLAPLVFHPVSNKNWETRDTNKFYQTGGPTGYIARSQDEKTYQHIDQNNNINHVSSASILHSAISGVMHVAGNIPNLLPGLPGLPNLPGLPTLPSIPGMGTNPLQGITHIAEKGILHIADQALQGVIPGQATSGITHIAEQAISHQSLSSTITHIAQQAITHASLGGVINIVPSQGLTIGAPSSTRNVFATDPPTPSQPTNVNLLGSLSATLNVSAGGSISAAGSISGGSMSSGGAAVMTEPIPPQLINAPQTVTGSRSGGEALVSLLSALVTLGLIVNDTVA